jgi:RNA methyltransferase, TrmH family
MITSRDNQKLKFARSVRDGRETGFIFLEGARLADEAFEAGVEIADILVNEAFDNKESLAGATVVADRIFDSITDTKSPQGIVIIAKRPVTSIDRIEEALGAGDVPTVLFLQEINNPSNLGAIMRTAEAAGVTGVIISKGSAEVFSPKSLRAGMGSNLRLPVCEGFVLKEGLEWARRHKMISTAADINGTKRYSSIDWRTPRLLVFGSEAHGLNAAERESIDEIINIPMNKRVESLNLAVSCGIILFEARKHLVASL